MSDSCSMGRLHGARGTGTVVELKIREALERAGARSFCAAAFVEGVGPVASIGDGLELAPNSTQKLYTSAAALLALGPDYRFVTEVKGTGPLSREGTLWGHLVVTAGGDPFLSGRDISELAAAVRRAGVRCVRGSLVVDDSRYDRARRSPGWPSYYVPLWSGPLSALAIDGNRWNSDPEFLRDPVAANAEWLRAVLVDEGVSVHGSIRVDRPLARGILIATRESAPLTELLRSVLRNSDNFAAELILKELGARIGQADSAGGVTALRLVADQLGVGLSGRIDDGSGLSSRTLDLARRQVSWLTAVGMTRLGRMFESCLPVAGRDGTLRGRFRGTAAEGRVAAKTGSRPVTGSVNLAGYAMTSSARRVSFSFMVDGATSPVTATATVDDAVVALVELAP